LSVGGAGEPIARGRDAAVYALGDGRVLRRYRAPGPTGRELRVMAWARSHGSPVPQVYERTDTDLILDHLDGPTMLGDLGRRPWRLHRHAKTLAGLHRQLHAIAAPAELPAPLGEGGSLVHLDLHQGNVILTASGPTVSDWPNAARGDGLADVASTWVILTTSRLEGSGLHRLMLATGRRLFAAAFLAGFDRRAVFGSYRPWWVHGLATALCLTRSVSVSVGCWRSLAIGRPHSSWTLELGEDLVGSLPARPAVRWLLVTWFRFSGHRRLIEGVVQGHGPTQRQGK
jgi:Phosphotransferase enzyme family